MILEILGNVGVTGTVDIGNSNTTSIVLDGTTYKTDGATEFDAVTTGQAITITGESPTFTTTAGNLLKFSTADVELSGTAGGESDVGTTTFNAAGGLTIEGNIIGKSGMSGVESLTISSGAGAIDIAGTVGNDGNGKALGTLLINNAAWSRNY